MISAAAFAGAAYAGEVVAEQPQPTAESHTCDALKSLGKLYKDDFNPFIQEVKFFGRGQFQYGYVDGSEESEGYSEWRRVRLGAQVKFAKFFDVMLRANLENGGRNDHNFEFGGYDEAKVGVNLGKAFGIDSFDKVYLSYGRDKIEIGEDVHTSSKKIKTVERTALTGKIRPDNSTGFALSLEKGDWKGAVGVFSADEGDDEVLFDDFSSEKFFYATSTFGLTGGDLIVDLIINPDADEVDSDYRNNWATSVAYRTEVFDWDLALNAVLGDEEEDGLFYGLVVQPSKYIIEDKLEIVGRYYFQASDNESGIKPNSRVSSKALGGSGDMHHSVYAGLNYYLCGHNAKLVTGIEYEALDTPDGGNNATTLWGAFRFYF